MYPKRFNPVLQGKKFDPKGDYVRCYVPELAKLDTAHLHAPWEAPAEALANVLGKTYPEPMVDHGKARQRALQA